MIELNLLPSELRKKESKFGFEISKETFRSVMITIIAIIVFIHIILIGSLFIKKVQFSRSTKEWQEILPQKNKIDALKNEYESVSDKTRAIDKLTKKGRISWAKKLNSLSDVLMQGVWLRRLDFSGSQLTLEGSSVSLKGEDVILVNRFTSKLKNNSDFYSNFKELEVESIKRRQIKNIEVADFILVIK